MKIFDFFRRKKDKKFTDSSEKKTPVIPVQSNKPLDTSTAALVKFVMSEEKDANLVFGRQNKERIFICFKNVELAQLFKDWYAALELREKNNSDKVYEMFLKEICEKYGIEYPEEKSADTENPEQTEDNADSQE